MHSHPTWQLNNNHNFHLATPSHLLNSHHPPRTTINKPPERMASLAASTMVASFSVSEMFGNPLNFSGASRIARKSAVFKRRNLHPRLSWQPSLRLPMSSPSGTALRGESPRRKVFWTDRKFQST